MESNHLQQQYPGFQHVQIEALGVSDNEHGMTHLMSQHLGYLIHNKMVLAQRHISLAHSLKLGSNFGRMMHVNQLQRPHLHYMKNLKAKNSRGIQTLFLFL